jgi:hypothetical protein
MGQLDSGRSAHGYRSRCGLGKLLRTDEKSEQKRSHQVIENKGPQTSVDVKRSHQVIENKRVIQKQPVQIASFQRRKVKFGVISIAFGFV